MNFFRTLVGDSDQRSRASSSLINPNSSFTPSFSALRTRESDDESNCEDFDEVTMDDVRQAERPCAHERQESETDTSQGEDARGEEIAAHAKEEDENSVRREYEKGPPLNEETWAGFSDEDGRIVNELKLRKYVFRGGIDESIRQEVWSFLFGLYPLSSTYREREVISADYHVKYQALKKRWQTMLHLVTSSEAMPLLPDYISDEVDYETSEVTGERGNERVSASGSIDSVDSSEDSESLVAHINVDSGEKYEQFSFAELQAQVYATRQPVDLANLRKAVKLIDKDVPRTDRDQPVFRLRQNLKVLRDILITYAAFHPDVSYVQGMNDIAGRFLYVFRSEVEAYWCLDRYVDTIKEDFLQETMLAKISLVGKLLEEMDPELYSFMQSVDLGHLVFCHRWLILCFKREFEYKDSIQLFEILSSCHLELTSLEAEQARTETRIEQVLKEEGRRNEKADQVEIHQEYTFDLFVCVAILKEHREELMACADQNLVFQYISSFTMKLDVATVLEKSQELFFLYCKKSVMDCFQQDSSLDGSATKT